MILLDDGVKNVIYECDVLNSMLTVRNGDPTLRPKSDGDQKSGSSTPKVHLELVKIGSVDPQIS